MPSLIPPVLHPIFVHAAIGFLLLVPPVATVAALRRGHWSARALPWLFTVAILATAVTVATGLIEEDAAEAAGGSEDAAEPHQTLGIATLVVFGALWAWAIWKRAAILEHGAPWALVAALWLALVLLIVTGWYGGALVFEQGVGVARHAAGAATNATVA